MLEKKIYMPINYTVNDSAATKKKARTEITENRMGRDCRLSQKKNSTTEQN